MKSLIYFITVYTLPSICVNSLVVTKLDMNSFISYYQSEIMEHNVEKIKELNVKTDLFKYCDQLRQARIFKAANTIVESFQDPSMSTYVFSKETLITERDQTQMQLFKFRLGNSKQTVTFWGFPCMNYEKNTSWIVAPTFVPDAAFLFEFELNFQQLSQREIKGGSEVIAHSVAFVDQDGILIEENVYLELVKYKKKPNERDPLCDLHPVLKYRLCSLAVSAAKPSRPPVADLLVHNITSREYTVEESKQYFNPNNSDDGCRAVILFCWMQVNKNFFAYRQMLRCPIKKRVGMFFFIGLDLGNSTRLIFSFGNQHCESQWRTELHMAIDIPLLRHINLDKNN